jgi:phosphohistidine phosphatase
MLAYLVQHGKAKAKEEDPDRPLTEEGRKEVEAVMLLMMQFGAVTAARVVHSGKRRAEETAELIASKLEADVEAGEGLGADDEPHAWAERLRSGTQDLVLVGHLPHLERLASLLLCGDPDARVVRFANGGMVCLNGQDGRWSVQWAVTPDLVQE